MDYGFIKPRCVRQLKRDTLLRTKAEYREAERVLHHTSAPGGKDFRRELARATRIVDDELKRRKQVAR